MFNTNKRKTHWRVGVLKVEGGGQNIERLSLMFAGQSTYKSHSLVSVTHSLGYDATTDLTDYRTMNLRTRYLEVWETIEFFVPGHRGMITQVNLSSLAWYRFVIVRRCSVRPGTPRIHRLAAAHAPAAAVRSIKICCPAAIVNPRITPC